MKKIKFLNLKLSALSAITSLFISCGNPKKDKVKTDKTESKSDTKEFKIVTDDEYNGSTNEEKRLYDRINASVKALDALKSDDDMEAIISISKNDEDKFSNFIIIAKSEGSNSITAKDTASSCRVCGNSSAFSCLKKIRKEINSDKFDVNVRREQGCTVISWKGHDKRTFHNLTK